MTCYLAHAAHHNRFTPLSPYVRSLLEANRLLRIEGLAVAGGAALHLVEVRGEDLGVRRQPAATVPPVDQAVGPTATKEKRSYEEEVGAT